ncbi:MAG: hypothetical protein AB7P40_27530 [Chloroflexota bacterium]
MTSPRAVDRRYDDPPEGWYNIAGGLLLGLLLLLTFGTHALELEQTPPELLFGLLGLYFYAVGYLSGRRTGKVGTGAWAGVAAGLAFGIVVCIVMFTSPFTGMRQAVQGGQGDQIAIAWSSAVFFVAVGGCCGALGARFAIRVSRRMHRLH